MNSKRYFIDDSCFLPDVIYMTKASVFQRIDEVESPKECQLRCQEIVNCTHWTWADLEMKSLSKACFLQNGDNVVQKKRLHYVSGPKHCTGKVESDHVVLVKVVCSKTLAIEDELLFIKYIV